jgi:hypothetical protein
MSIRGDRVALNIGDRFVLLIFMAAVFLPQAGYAIRA